jgi:hypothetical protein
LSHVVTWSSHWSSHVVTLVVIVVTGSSQTIKKIIIRGYNTSNFRLFNNHQPPPPWHSALRWRPRQAYPTNNQLTNKATITSPSLVGPDDVEQWIATLRSGECLSERSLRRLCESASELLMEESNVQPVLSPMTIIGDLHGQFYDLLQLISPEVGGASLRMVYMYLGDFVDRGHNSVETLSLLLCLKGIMRCVMKATTCCMFLSLIMDCRLLNITRELLLVSLRVNQTDICICQRCSQQAKQCWHRHYHIDRSRLWIEYMAKFSYC